MPTQYDAIGTAYNNMHDLPGAQPEFPSAISALGNITDLRCLDLACGTGRYSRLLLSLGARSVLGIDISRVMISGAQEASLHEPRLKYKVADCSKPLAWNQEMEGDFDLVFAAWFLNYASSRSSMLQMWQNIHDSLRPGGRFVGIVPNVEMSMAEPLLDHYGSDVVPVERVEEGWKCRLTAHTEPPVVFEIYHLDKKVYEGCAEKAGMRDMKWIRPVLPDDERRGTSYWDKFMERAPFLVCTDRKSVV